MRMSHANEYALGCAPVDRLYADGIQEIGEWVHKPENQGKVIRLYFEVNVIMIEILKTL